MSCRVVALALLLANAQAIPAAMTPPEAELLAASTAAGGSAMHENGSHEELDESGHAVKVDIVEDHQQLWDMPTKSPEALAKLKSVTVLTKGRDATSKPTLMTLQVSGVAQGLAQETLDLDVANCATLHIDAKKQVATLTKTSGEVLDIVDHTSKEATSLLASHKASSGWGGALMTAGSFTMMASGAIGLKMKGKSELLTASKAGGGSGTHVDGSHEMVDKSGHAVKMDIVEDHKQLWDMPAESPEALAKLKSVTVLTEDVMVRTLQVTGVVQSLAQDTLELEVPCGTVHINATKQVATLKKTSGEVLDIVDHTSKEATSLLASHKASSVWGGALMTAGSFTMMASGAIGLKMKSKSELLSASKV